MNDFQTGKLHVRRAKGGTASIHPIGGRELRALRRLKREAPASVYVFVSERLAPLSVAGYQRMVARAGEAAGFRFLVHSHMLRHSCGYKLANDGQDTRAIQHYLGHKSRHFLINAAPGAGKTLAACTIAKTFFDRNEIDRVIVIAPRAEVVNQWADDFRRVTGRFMGKVTPTDENIQNLQLDVCATWSAVQGLLDAFQAVCRTARVLLICDEHHHAAVEAAWGSSADSAFKNATYVLVLTGTPIRSDGSQSVWLAYDDAGAIDHPEEGTYTITYGEAVDLGYCRPVTFHRHEGNFTVDLEGGEHIKVSSKQPPELPPNLTRIPGLQRALNFYRLACTPQFEKDGRTPLADGYQASMLSFGSQKLTELRYRMPTAGGLVIAPSIEIAEYMMKLLEQIEGETPVLVHSQMNNADNRIKAFRNTDKRWLVSVAMVSEGVDISRLRLLVYLSNVMTELAFRQAIGRAVRSAGPADDTRAYVIMPSFDTFEVYARRVESEMSPSARLEDGVIRTKTCPACNQESPLNAATCSNCGHVFPLARGQFKSCYSCGALNHGGATACHACGNSFQAEFKLSLDEALRAGAIVRGMDIDENEVRLAEQIAPNIRNRILKTGDNTLVRILQVLPEESWARLKAILEAERQT